MDGSRPIMQGDIAVSNPGKDGTNQANKDSSSRTCIESMQDNCDQSGVIAIEKELDKLWNNGMWEEHRERTMD